MKKYIKSITTALICFLIITVLNFLLPRLLPGDPVAYLTGLDDAALSSEKYEFYQNALHLKDDLWVQFAYYIKSIFDGTLGFSYKQNCVVSDLVFDRLWYTLQITVPALILSTVLGLAMALFCAEHKGEKTDNLITSTNVTVNSIPVFVIGIAFVIAFCFRLKIFPYTGLNSIGVSKGGIEYVFDRIYHLILPVTVLVIAQTPSRFIVLRNAAMEVADDKYVLYAKTRGLSKRVIKYKYIFPNIIGQFISMLGMSMASCVGGSLVIENVFSIKGMGTLLTDAVYSLDYPLMQGVLFVSTAIMVCAIIVSDVLCIFLDPRLRFKYEGSLSGGVSNA